RFHLTHLLRKGLKGNSRLRSKGQGNQYLKHSPNQTRSDPEDVCWPRKISVCHGTPASSVASHCAREDGARQVPRNASPSPERIDGQIVSACVSAFRFMLPRDNPRMARLTAN